MRIKEAKTPEEIEAMRRELAEAEGVTATQQSELSDAELEAQEKKIQAERRKRNIAASAGLLKDFLPRFVTLAKDAVQTAVEKCGGWRSNSAAPGGSKLLQGGGVKFDNLRRFDCELKRAGGRAASLQLAPPGVEWSFVSGCRLRSV
jgi:hypothetical protein